MVRSLSTSRRAHSRRFAVSALATSIALALGSAHAQSFSATSVPITGRAPVVTIAGITNQTVPGQTPAVGHVLHANASVVDPDNDAILDTIYRWKRGGIEVGTGVDYTTTAADAGQTLTLEVEATTDSTITDPDRGSATSTVNVVGNAAPTATPTITFDGVLDVGTALTGNPGYADTENDPQGVHTYQWYRADDATRTNQVAISGATNTTYTVTSADRGKFIVLGVVPHATVGPAQGSEGFATTAIGVPVAATAPEARVPQVTGNLRNGSVLASSFDYFDNELDPPGLHKYQWFRSDDGINQVDIDGATNDYYVLSSADQGDHYIGVRITPVSTLAPTDGAAVSARTTAKFSAVAPTASPTITYDGVLSVGTVMTAHSGFNDVNNDTELDSTYQWCEYLANGAGLEECFAPTTSNTYTVKADQANRAFKVRVTPRSDSAQLPDGVMVESALTANVAISNLEPEARTPSISGDLKTGSTLTAAFDYFDNDHDPQGEHRYQWFRDNGTTPVDIAGATSKDYVLTGADQGDHYIGVRITPVSTVAPTDGTPVEARTAAKFLGTAPSAAPTISFEGALGVGTVLTANAGFNDLENDQELGTTFQWCAYDAAGDTLVGCAPASASATWTVLAGNVGQRLSVKVIPRAGTGTPNAGAQMESAKTAVIVANAPTANPTITGNLRLGAILEAHSGYIDADNDLEEGTTYQWCSWDADGVTSLGCMAPSTNRNWTVMPSNVGRRLSVKVVPRSANGETGAEIESPLTAVITESAPTATPTISFDGTLAIGTVLTGGPGYADVENDPEGTHSYQWYRADDASRTNQVAISGATGTTYTVAAADYNKFVVLGVIPRATAGTPLQGVEGFGVTTGPVIGGSAPTANPTISGQLRQGKVLSVNSGFIDADNDLEEGTTYQWCSWDADGVTSLGCVAPSTNGDWTVMPSNVGRRLSVKVIPKSSTGDPNVGEEVESAKTVVIGPEDVPVASNASISNNAAYLQSGATLTANFTYGGPYAQSTHLYQWYMATDSSGSNRANISGATSKTFTLAAGGAYEGRYIGVEITPVSVNGVQGAKVRPSTARSVNYYKSSPTDFGLGNGWISILNNVNITNRPGNPGVVRIRGYRNTNGTQTAPNSVDVIVTSPNGLTWTLAGATHGGTMDAAFNAAGATGNGTWTIKVKKTDSYPAYSPNTLYHDWFSLDFTGN